MASKFAILLAAAALTGCSHTPYDLADRGLAAVNVPVVARTDYVFDASAPDGSLSPGEAARLNAWFSGMNLGYGDSIYVDGPYAGAARADVAQVAGNYGLMVAPSAPVTAGAVPPGMVRVIVSRTRASVPGCPNWSLPAQPNYNNRMIVQLRLRGELQSRRHGRQPRGPGPRPRRHRRRRYADHKQGDRYLPESRADRHQGSPGHQH